MQDSRIRELLGAITTAQSAFVEGAPLRTVFDGLLSTLLETTESEYGFIGEVLEDPDSKAPYLRTHAITNIAWNEATRQFYELNAPKGLEFRNLKTLFGSVLVSDSPVIANEPAQDRRSGGTPSGHPALNSFLGIPFRCGGTTVGNVGIANRKGGYDAQLVTELEPFLATCANIIGTVRANNLRTAAEDELRRQAQELAQSNEDLREFATVAAHDLRTPVRGIATLAQWIERDIKSSPDAAMGHVRRLASRVDRLDRLTAGLLSYASAGTRREIFEPLAIRKLVEDLVEDLRGNKPLKMQFELTTETVLAPPTAFETVVRNLLDNAIKHASRDREFVNIVVRLFEHEGTYELEIEDNGPGISPEYRARAFQMFQTLNPRDEVEGSGIGLALVRRSIERHGGSIHVDDARNGEGARFIIVWPKGPAPTPDVLPAPWAAA